MKEKDIEAEITFLTTEEGGRKGPAFSGYRPQFYYDGQHWDAEHNYIGVDEAYPGQTVMVYLTFASPRHHVGKLFPGKEFLIYEGLQIVARGKVIKIINLEQSAENQTQQNS